MNQEKRQMQNMAKVYKFSTGTVQIRPQHVGPTKLPPLVWLMTARKWTAPRPINVYVIKHEQGIVVFDTGQDRASVTNPDYFPRGLVGWLYSRLAKFKITEGETFLSGLASLGVGLDDLRYAVISHLHQDHIGGLPALAQSAATVIASKDELAASNKFGAVLDGYMLEHIEIEGLTIETPRVEDISSLQIQGFDQGWDVFGDGTLVVVSLKGHTEGSLGMIVNWKSELPCFLVGDLTYDSKLMESGVVPGVGNKSELFEASSRVAQLKKVKPSLVIAAAHDPYVVLPEA
jgi:N-acyl homoserine lactone hydrolase